MDETARYTTANLPAHLLRCLAETSRELGIDPTRLCLGLGFDVADLSNPSCRISLRQAGAMIRRALEMAPARALGLELGMSETIASIGLVGYAMLTSPTVKDAIAVGMRLQRHTGPLMHFDMVADARTLSICATNTFLESDIEAFLVEEAFGSFLKIGRSLAGSAFQPKAVDLSYPRPDYAVHYMRVFQCPVRFEQAHNLFAFDAAWGDRAIATHDPLAHRQALEFLQTALPAEPEGTDFLESIERIVRRDLRCAPALSAIAAQLCMSERTLRRRLADQGVSYQIVIDTIRKKRAFKLLNNPRLSIEDVAHEVGYSDSHNFRRAFKRWTGHGPRDGADGIKMGE
ncbi:AraC family transcriptional regulator [Burkholderia ubonensis]|uniref:AraC family transcriptional regulator n=1 Tax=Burkholderia ubonensis TaxID=101571 RepID=UPI00075350EC|nr:AraC family transcriptional regulator [Burkholderia ubonensis]KVM65657.1 AraC family transcriptional regulator [Burkholderia ubonensis]KVX92606.1 AraC family transcriptional regulator [Burkholderia ubonensis]